jgi:DNA-directed RNA polymerase subunit RPC12/RpoP
MTEQDLSNLTPEQLKFLQALTDTPEKIAKVFKTSVLTEFKNKYDVSFSSGLKCPYCSDGQYVGGPLWTNNEYLKYVCRRCFNVWEIKLITGDIIKLVTNLKKVKKTNFNEEVQTED